MIEVATPMINDDDKVMMYDTSIHQLDSNICLDSISFSEVFDIKQLEYILENKIFYETQMREETFKNGHNPFSLCKKYLNSISKTGKVKVNYKKIHGEGRWFAENSLSMQSMCREIRASIAHKIYWDIDFSNCHPTILKYLCNQFDLEHKFISEYIYNRKQVIDDIINVNENETFDSVKEIILKTISGGELKLTKNTNWSNGFVKEIKEIHNIIPEIYPEQYEQKKILKGNNYWNLKGSTLSSILCNLENMFLEFMMNYFKKNKCINSVGVLCFDGIMIPKKKNKDLEILENHLRTLENMFIEQFNIPLKLKVKEMEPMPSKVPKEFKTTTMDKIKRWLKNPDRFFHKLQNENIKSKTYNARRTKKYDEFINKPLVFIKEPKGCGKTHQAVRYIENYSKKDDNILFITFRTTLSYELQKRLKNLGFKNYKNINGDITDKNNRLIIQAESLKRLDWTKCDLLFCDEIESLLPQMITKETMKMNMKKCFNKFEALIEESKQVICMDADITNNTIDYISNMNGNTPHIRENTYNSREQDTIFYTTSQDTFISNIVEDAKRGLKLAIGSNRGKYKLEALKNLIINQDGCEDLKIGLFTSDTIHDEEVMKIIKDCESKENGFSQFDIIIFSPTIQAGVSFNPQDAHFDKFYGWFCSNGRVNGVRQMIKRVRKLNTNQYIYCLNQIGCSSIPDNRKDFEKFISSNRNFSYNFEVPDFIPQKVKLNGDIEYPYKDNFYNLWSEQQILLAKDENNFVYLFLKAEYHSGVRDFKELKDPEELIENAGKQINEEISDIKEVEIENISKADMISQEEFESLNKKTNNSKGEYFEIRKYTIKESLKLQSEPTKEIISHCVNSKVQKYFYNLNQYATALKNNNLDNKRALIDLIEQDKILFEKKDKCEIQDAVRNYKSKKHYICYKMVRHCGFTDILDDREINAEYVKKMVSDETKKEKLSEGISEIGILWGLPKKRIPNPEKWKDNLYLKEYLKFINPKLKDMYGIQIKKTENRKNYKIFRDDMLCYDPYKKEFPNIFGKIYTKPVYSNDEFNEEDYKDTLKDEKYYELFSDDEDDDELYY